MPKDSLDVELWVVKDQQVIEYLLKMIKELGLLPIQI
jgi:hypothetical protein